MKFLPKNRFCKVVIFLIFYNFLGDKLFKIQRAIKEQFFNNNYKQIC